MNTWGAKNILTAQLIVDGPLFHEDCTFYLQVAASENLAAIKQAMTKAKDIRGILDRTGE